MSDLTPRERARAYFIHEGIEYGADDPIGYAEGMLSTTTGHALVAHYAFRGLMDELAATPRGRLALRFSRLLGRWRR